MFDSIELPDPDPVSHEIDPSTNVPNALTAFDDLEVRSSYFEQNVIQNVVSDASDCDRLGGLECVKALFRTAFDMGLSPVAIKLRPHERFASTESPPASRESICDVVQESGIRVMKLQISSHNETSSQFGEDVITAANASRLLWFDVRNLESAEPAKFREQALSQIIQSHQAIPVTERPILIVTGLIGVAKPLEDPLEAGVDEGLMRVPLWVDVGAEHPRRIQTLSGSFDLVPTIADFLGVCVRPSIDDSSCTAPGLSLHPLCGIQSFAYKSISSDIAVRSDDPIAKDSVETDPQTSFDRRILSLVGDDWTGLRAQQYLLIHQEMSDAADAEFPVECKRQLFLKPDDVWNISDVIVSYDAIADEMEAQAGLAR
jgi:hypothetical protein